MTADRLPDRADAKGAHNRRDPMSEWTHHPVESAEALPETLAATLDMAAAEPLDREALAATIAVAQAQAGAVVEVLASAAARVAREPLPDADDAAWEAAAMRDAQANARTMADALERALAALEAGDAAAVGEALADAHAFEGVAGIAEDSIDYDALEGGQA